MSRRIATRGGRSAMLLAVAAAALVALVAFIAFERTAMAAPTVVVRAPADGAVVTGGRAVDVAVRVTPVGGFPVSQVKATLGATTIDLYLNGAGGEWLGQFSPLPVPNGPATLTVVAYDTAPSQTTVTRDFIRDDAPVVVFEGGHVGLLQPLMPRIRLRCTDNSPAGCTSLVVTVQRYPQAPVVVATGTSNIDTVIDLSAYADANALLIGRGTDDRGTTKGESITIFPTARPFPMCDLDMRAEHSGVVDGDDARLLIGRNVWIDRATGVSTPIVVPANYTGSGIGMLVPGGVLSAVRRVGATPVQLMFSRTSAEVGTMRTWDLTETAFPIVVLGDYVCGGGRAVSTAASGSLGDSCDGRTTFSPNDGMSCARFLPVDPLVDTSASLAACDDGNVLYAYSTKSIPGQHRGLRYRSRAGVVTDIAPERSDGLYTPRDSNALAFDVAGDWAVFVNRDAAGDFEWFRRTPTGAVEQLTVGDQGRARLLGFAPNGEVLLSYPFEIRKLAPGQDWNNGTWLGPSRGEDTFRARWRGRWFLTDTQSAYAENVGAAKPMRCPVPAPPAASDAGTDAGAPSTGDAGDGDAGASGSSSSSGGASGSSGFPPDAGGSDAAASEAATASADGCNAGGSASALPVGLLTLLALYARRRRAGRA